MRRRHAICSRGGPENRQVMPDDHSELVPPLPIPNRTVKRLCADDSAATSVKVGHRQAVIRKPPALAGVGGICFGRRKNSSMTNGWRLCEPEPFESQRAQTEPGQTA